MTYANAQMSPQTTVSTQEANTSCKSFLMAAALQQLELVYYFIETEGLHPDTTWGGKPTAICYAVLKRNSQLTAYLLNKGADPNRIDALGMTPLHYAALGGCEICTAHLLNRGALLNAVNGAGQTPLALARSKACAASSACCELLSRYGAALHASMPGPKRLH